MDASWRSKRDRKALRAFHTRPYVSCLAVLANGKVVYLPHGLGGPEWAGISEEDREGMKLWSARSGKWLLWIKRCYGGKVPYLSKGEVVWDSKS